MFSNIFNVLFQCISLLHDTIYGYNVRRIRELRSRRYLVDIFEHKDYYNVSNAAKLDIGIKAGNFVPFHDDGQSVKRFIIICDEQIHIEYIKNIFDKIINESASVEDFNKCDFRYVCKNVIENNIENFSIYAICVNSETAVKSGTITTGTREYVSRNVFDYKTGRMFGGSMGLQIFKDNSLSMKYF